MIGSIPMEYYQNNCSNTQIFIFNCVSETPHKIGKEVITRYWISPFESRRVFFTDSNGREMMPRLSNYRPTWNADIKEPVAGNYFPVTTVISTRDSLSEFGVLVDRAQGATSLEEGVLEIMVSLKFQKRQSEKSALKIIKMNKIK